MSDFENEMSRIVMDFVARVSDLARVAAIDTLQKALGGGASVAGASPSTSRGARAVPTTKRGGRRNADQLEQLKGTVVSHVKANPGSRMEHLNRALGTATKDLARPIRMLIDDGLLKTKGERRGTQYFVR